MITSFAAFGLAEPLNRALQVAGYETPTPIQAEAIPHLIAGRDLLGLAQTGTGKTAAFVLPILQRLRSAGTKPESRTARALILAPTRELAIQIHESVRDFAKGQHLAHACVFGGVGINPQIEALRRGLDILVATPGRLMDLINQRHCRLDAVRFFVLDEADRMLDMGFIRDIKRILALLPKERQSMLFSATMPESIGEIAGKLLRDPVTVEVRPQAVPVDRIEQHVVFAPSSAKREALRLLLSDRAVTRALVFARTKHGANRIADFLTAQDLEATVIHGNKSQAARQKALAAFKSGETRILVATDIAARGIDVADVSHIFNADLPDEPENYVHRIGRTARAGRFGAAITLCDASEKDKLRAIERLTKHPLKPMLVEGFDPKKPSPPPKPNQDSGRRRAEPPSRVGERKERRPDERDGRHHAANARKNRRGGGKRPDANPASRTENRRGRAEAGNSNAGSAAPWTNWGGRSR